jgi:hypothetical protein
MKKTWDSKYFKRRKLEYIRGEKSHVAPLIAIQEGNCDWQGSAL